MSQLFVQINVYGDIWHVDTTSGITQASVYANVPVALTWQDSSTETIASFQRLSAQGSGALTVDITSTDYLIVALKGTGSAQLVPIAQLLNLATIYTGLSWAVLGVASRSGPRAWEQ